MLLYLSVNKQISFDIFVGLADEYVDIATFQKWAEWQRKGKDDKDEQVSIKPTFIWQELQEMYKRVNYKWVEEISSV